jgi:hypothetical protein
MTVDDLTLGRRTAMKFLPEEPGGDRKARDAGCFGASRPNVCEMECAAGSPSIVSQREAAEKETSQRRPMPGATEHRFYFTASRCAS